MSFTVNCPATIDEALGALKVEGSSVMAGGTDLMVWVEEGTWKPHHVVNIGGITELRNIEYINGMWRIGAAVTFMQLLEHKGFSESYRCLMQAAIQSGGPQIRNAGTIGGNICTASPAGDVTCALIALDAIVELQSQEGIRTIPLKDFLLSPRKTDRMPGELLVAVLFPANMPGKSLFFKLGKRNSLIIATVNVSVWIDLQENMVNDVRIAIGSAAPKVVRARGAELSLRGKILDSNTIAEAKIQVDKDITPITDLRATASYRRKVCGNVVAELLEKLGGAY